MESDYSPLEGSLQNEILKLEDLLSQCTYKTKNDGGRNLAAEVENEAVMLPSIYANLKEDQLQQTGLQIEKQQAIARVDIRKVSPYFASEGGPKVEETIRNKNSVISKHSRGDGDPRKDKKRGKRKDDRISKECTKSNEILGFEKAILIDEDVGLTEGFDGNAKGRRKDSRRYTQQDLEGEDHKMESDYSPLEGSLQNEILKLEDLLSQCTYKTKNDGGRNLAAEVENEAVMLPSIYANLKEDQLQQTGLQIEKQQAIARVDVRKVSPYFANEGGPKVEETIRNKNSVISKHSRGDGDPRKDKKRGKRKDDRNSKECTKSNEILGFEKAVLIDEDVGLTEGFDGNAKGRRNDSRHYTRDFHKMVVKDEEREMEDEEQKMELDYKIKRRTSPFEGSLQNEDLKLEDVLSQYAYRSHDVTKNGKNGQHDEEQEKKCSKKISFPFEMTNNSSVLPDDGSRNLAGKVENEAVILPNIHTNLKEEQVLQNGLEIGKVSHSKWRRRNEKQQAIAHVEIRKVSPYFWRSTGQVVRNDGDGTKK
ncbi:hypothetical protein RGQ29_000078 [Quercus rubra]|nr:hypothetical protein RGQ29_000078 [Quercus rubra]